MTFESRSQNYLSELSELFKFLSRDPSVAAAHPKIAESARIAFNTTRMAINNPKRNSTISISPNWMIPIKSESVVSAAGIATLFIGGEISFSGGRLKQQALSVAITFMATEDHTTSDDRYSLKKDYTYVVRRIHFDFDGDLADHDRPVEHIQVGGKLSPTHLYGHDCIPSKFVSEPFPQLDLPRIPYPVTDLATLLETFLRQFAVERSNFLDEKGWIVRVCSMENIWLKYYYSNALKQIEKSDRKCTLYTHLCRPTSN